jgi:hypothetical protein
MWWKTAGFCKRRGFSWLAERLSAVEGLLRVVPVLRVAVSNTCPVSRWHLPQKQADTHSGTVFRIRNVATVFTLCAHNLMFPCNLECRFISDFVPQLYFSPIISRNYFHCVRIDLILPFHSTFLVLGPGWDVAADLVCKLTNRSLAFNQHACRRFKLATHLSWHRGLFAGTWQLCTAFRMQDDWLIHHSIAIESGLKFFSRVTWTCWNSSFLCSHSISSEDSVFTSCGIFPSL